MLNKWGWCIKHSTVPWFPFPSLSSLLLQNHRKVIFSVTFIVSVIHFPLRSIYHFFSFSVSSTLILAPLFSICCLTHCLFYQQITRAPKNLERKLLCLFTDRIRLQRWARVVFEGVKCPVWTSSKRTMEERKRPLYLKCVCCSCCFLYRFIFGLKPISFLSSTSSTITEKPWNVWRVQCDKLWQKEKECVLVWCLEESQLSILWGREVAVKEEVWRCWDANWSSAPEHKNRILDGRIFHPVQWSLPPC